MSIDTLNPFQNLPLLRIGTVKTRVDDAIRPYVQRTPLDPAPVDILHLITSRSGFEAIEDEWNQLFEHAGRSEQMFQTFNWLWHWTNRFCAVGMDSLAIVVARREGRIVAILPLAVERVAGLRQLAFMGAPVSQYGDVLSEPLPDRDAVLTRALQFAIATTRADVVRLAKVRDDAMIAPVLLTLGAELTGFEEAPYVDLAAAGTQAAYDERFSTKNKKNRRRLERRLAEHGAIGLDWTLSGTPAAHAARTTMVLKRAWLKTRGQLSRALADRRTETFFADVCSGTHRPCGAHVSLLTAGGEIADAAITVTVKGRQAVHILAYGLKFEKCAAGILHVEKMVARAFATGIATLDFLAPRHEYKLEWADGVMRVADYAVPVTLVGKAYTRIYLKHVREGLKAVLKSVPRSEAGMLAIVQAALRRVRG